MFHDGNYCPRHLISALEAASSNFPIASVWLDVKEPLVDAAGTLDHRKCAQTANII